MFFYNLWRKYEEICAPRVEEFCFITDNTYAREEVRLVLPLEVLFCTHKCTCNIKQWQPQMTEIAQLCPLQSMHNNTLQQVKLYFREELVMSHPANISHILYFAKTILSWLFVYVCFSYIWGAHLNCLRLNNCVSFIFLYCNDCHFSELYLNHFLQMMNKIVGYDDLSNFGRVKLIVF